MSESVRAQRQAGLVIYFVSSSTELRGRPEVCLALARVCFFKRAPEGGVAPAACLCTERQAARALASPPAAKRRLMKRPAITGVE